VLTPKRGPFISARRAVRGALHENSSLARFAEEALAGGYATGSLKQAIRFLFKNNYVNVHKVAAEAAGVSGVGWLMYEARP